MRRLKGKIYLHDFTKKETELAASDIDCKVLFFCLPISREDFH